MGDRRGSRAHARRWFAPTIGGVLAIAVLAVAAIMWGGPLLTAASSTAAPTATPSATPTPAPVPLTPAQRLLADAHDPAACIVSLQGEGVIPAFLVESQERTFQGLPIPTREGFVFAGWYTSPESATGLDQRARVNGGTQVVCDATRQLPLTAAWVMPDENAAADTAVPILMYHQFTDKPEGESGWLRGNYAYVGDWRAHIAYISEGGFYLPTWRELEAFIDGRLFLPPRSVIITDDDADPTWIDLAVPILDEFRVPATSFVITAYRQAPSPSIYVVQESHTHDMHTAGENGRGRMVNWSVEQITADLRTSIGVLGGSRDVLAYPYGHYDDSAKQGVAAAGIRMARTIEQGYVRVGTDKLALPCIRIDYGMSVDDLARRIG